MIVVVVAVVVVFVAVIVAVVIVTIVVAVVVVVVIVVDIIIIIHLCASHAAGNAGIVLLVSVCEYECLCEDVSVSLYAKTARLLIIVDKM